MDKPFSSDECSVIGPIARWFGYRNARIDICCYAHDRAYWRGGTLKIKRRADARFFSCLITNARAPGWVAILMLIGVTLGGFIPHPSFRWGFGWKFPKYKG